MSGRVPVLYLAPWVDFGGTDKGTIDWFRWIDRDRFAPSLITTQPSPNRRLAEVAPYADEVWALPDLMAGAAIPEFVLGFVASRRVPIVHVMNSRIGYELLPDLDALPARPRLVVQLHVEEPDLTGYVRYVTTRFGNLVDAFSVTSHHLADAVAGYGVPRGRIHVIPTGVDADLEFSPDRVRPRPLGGGGFQILYPGRLVQQKDPLLMVEVVDRLRRRREDFRIQIVGEGELEAPVRAEIARRGLERWVEMSPATRRLHEWYAACDALLMTSMFEGVPYVLYEAMAMGLPAVVPALAGNVEVAPDETATLIEPRDGADAYADALARLIADPDAAAATGARAREHVRRHHTLAGMADAHGALYEELLGERPAEAPHERPARPPAPLRFTSRPSRGQPRVSILIPCFNHGPWLDECLDSVRAQAYPDLEIVVVDDGSRDGETLAVLDRVEAAPDVRLIRLEENSGPSAARNRGIAECTGRYVLPLDADNRLLPDAVDRLVRQLQLAGEEVGFVYQNLQHFGNREDYFEAPDYNLHTLLRLNYCDTSSLIDRDVFDAGLRFAEEVVDGHEDWDFFLRLAERGVIGEPAHAKTLLFRKHGFSRSERIDHAARFAAEVTARHPALMAGLWVEAPRLKARWAPALSVIALSPLRPDSPRAHAFGERMRSQTFLDFELLAPGDRETSWDGPPALRWLPMRRSGDGRDELLEEALRRARGRYVFIGQGTGTDLVESPARLEQVVRLLRTSDAPTAMAFVDLGDGAHELRPAEADELEGRHVHALAIGAGGVDLLRDMPVVPGDELGGIATELRLRAAAVEWRHLPAPTGWSPSAPAAPRPLRLEVLSDRHAQLEREFRLAAEPALRGGVHASRGDLGWQPIQSIPLYRYRRAGGEERVVTTGAGPPGFDFEYLLGLARTASFAGTTRLVVGPTGEYETRPLGEEPDAAEMARTLGYLEEVHFQGLRPVVRSRHAGTGQPVLLAGADDPLWGHVTGPDEHLGFIEAAPADPARRAHGDALPVLSGLVRAVDLDARRHRYAVGAVPLGTSAWELGALVGVPLPGTVPLRLDGDRVVLRGGAAATKPGAGDAVKWAVAPVAWSGFGRRAARGRAVLRRTVWASQLLLRPPASADAAGVPAGWLLVEPGPGRVPLYAATHPVTGDQLLSRYRVEAVETGYGEPILLGHMVATAPVTGTLRRPTPGIPWGSRFGQAVRWGLEGEDA